MIDTNTDIGLEKVRHLVNQITMSCFGTDFALRVERDVVYWQGGRVFLQIVYSAPCSRTGVVSEWKGRKWYLSEWMTDDEVVKTAYAAFEAAVRHEVMEGFKVGNIPLFNPHTHYLALLNASHFEINRES